MQSRLRDQLSGHPRLVAGSAIGAIVLVGVAVGLAIGAFGARPTGDASPVPSASVSPSGSPTSQASPSPTPGSSTTPTPTSAPSAGSSVPSTGFEYSDILKVEVNGLAVRRAPLLTSPLAQGYRTDGLTMVLIGDARLNAGDFVSVFLGPLPIGDTVWYLVWPAEDARLNYSPTVTWDRNGDFETVGGSDPAWVAASVGNDHYLTLHRRPETSEIEQFLPVALTVSGTGNYESEPQAEYDLFLFNWAVAVDDHPSPCGFSVTLVPQDGGDPVVAVETSPTEVEQGPSRIITPWRPSADGSWDSFTVSISSGCTWTVGLHPLGHD